MRFAPHLVAPVGAEPDEARPLDELGVENSIRTFSEESLFSGGLFSFQPEVKGAGADALEHYSDTLANLGISAVRPAIGAINPSAVPQGTSLDVELAGSNTNFQPDSDVAVQGAGVNVASTTVLSPTRMVVRLTAAPDAPLGFRDVTVTTNLGAGTVETAKGIGAVHVVGAPAGPTVLSITPSIVAAGSTRDIAISGALTHFAAGSSSASFGAGVTVNQLTVSSPTSAVAKVTVAPGATIGFRDVSVQTGGEVAGESVPGPLLVAAPTPAVPRLVSASPASGVRGATVDVTLTGADTAFTDGTSIASVSGTGVDVLSTTVQSPSVAVARLAIAHDAPLGFRNVTVATGVQDATLIDGFEVRPAPVPAATPTPSATPTPTPTAGPPPPPCTAHSAPRAELGRVAAKKGKLTIAGRAGETGCGARAIARVEVAVSRAAGRGKCRFVAANGKLGKARACSKPVFLRAKGTKAWSLSLKRKLAPGRYTILARARDAGGAVQAPPARKTVTLRRGGR